MSGNLECATDQEITGTGREANACARLKYSTTLPLT